MAANEVVKEATNVIQEVASTAVENINMTDNVKYDAKNCFVAGACVTAGCACVSGVVALGYMGFLKAKNWSSKRKAKKAFEKAAKEAEVMIDNDEDDVVDDVNE